MRINNNIMAMNTYRQLGVTNTNSSKAMEKLSSGLRINRAGDDAAGLSISEKMRAQIRGLSMASKNAQDGISLIQTAEGALSETHAILQRMRELAVQASSDTNVGVDRDAIQNEINELTAEIDRIANNTEFNTQNLLNASGGFNATFQVGANSNQRFDITINDMTATGLGLGLGDEGYSAISHSDETVSVANATNVSGDITVNGAYNGTIKADGVSSLVLTYSHDGTDASWTYAIDGGSSQTATVAGNEITIDGLTIDISGLTLGTANGDKGEFTITLSKANTGIDVSTNSDANTAIDTIDNAIELVSQQRSNLGAAQNRLEHTIRNLDTSAENLQAAESRIRDVDMAKEMMEFTKNNILQQAATAMLAQANQAPQGVLQLLR